MEFQLAQELPKLWGFLKSKHITENELKKVTELNDISQNRNQSLAQMALAWILRGGRVTSALIGASKPQQIIENVATLSNLDFSKEGLDLIDSILNS